MLYNEIIGTRFAGPAAIISYREGKVSILELNDEYLPEHWMNVSREDYISSFPDKVFDDADMSAFIEAVEKCVETGENTEVETWRKVFSNCCGNDKVCLKSRLVLVEKTPEGAVVFDGVRNISKEKRAIDSFEDVEYRYKQTLEQINIYNWEYTIATKEMRPCYRCMRDLGLPAVVKNYPDSAIEMGIFPPDYADFYRDMMRRIDEGATELEADIPLTVGRVPFRVKYTTMYDEEGKPVKSFGSATLISKTELGQIKLDNQIISALAEGFKCIFLLDFVADKVEIIKHDGPCEIGDDFRCNDLLAMVASRISDVSPEIKETLSDASKLRTQLFKDNDKREFVFKNEELDQWIRVDYHVIERGSLGIDRLFITSSYIDDLRAQKMDADRLIATQKTQLEDRQTMLLKAIDMANRANETKTEFFLNVSHDIRTPMNAITGFSRLAMEEIDHRDRLEDYLGKILTAGDHLTSLIDDILDMSRIESGKMDLNPAPVKLKDMMIQCADMVRVKMDENKLSFNVDVEGMGDDIVSCDKLRFNQMLINLLSNAYKYTREGGSVFFSGKLLEKADELKYEIRVRDTGIGMSKEFSERIWEPYTRENTDDVNETQGTGLGMVIVKNIINMMHGTIDLVSEQGIGSEFIIVLSVAPSSSENEENDKDSELEVILERDYSDKTVLVVDDTPMNLKLAERMLGKFGFNVKRAESGVEAIDIMKSSDGGHIDVILMDVMMPVMDGVEAARRIREITDPDCSGIPIIAMTANAMEADVKQTLDAGMDGHISKPYTKEILVSEIYTALKKAGRLTPEDGR